MKKRIAPKVTSLSANLRRTISPTHIITPEEVCEQKREVMDIIETGLGQFKSNLQDGLVELRGSVDLERLVKLMLLVSGEPDSIEGRPANEIEAEATLSLEGSRVDDILDLDDPTVKALYDKLYSIYNEQNDED